MFYAKLGFVEFQPITGFDSFGATEEATITEYPLIGQQAQPQPSAFGLRKLTIGARLHQQFINIPVAVADLKSNMRNGEIVDLVWSATYNTSGAGREMYYINSIKESYIEQDTQGNVLMLELEIALTLAPGKKNAVKQQSATKAAFANTPAYIPPTFTPPAPYAPSPWQVYCGYIKEAIVLGEKINSLSYGGQFPYLGQTLGAIIGNASANITLLQQNFDAYGIEYDDLGLTDTDFTNISTALSTLSTLDPIIDAPLFGAAHTSYQTYLRFLCF